MGSSAKRKKEKKKDFQKAKLKVGKTRPKATNFTDTSFKAKSIVLSRQSISVAAPSADSQFSHHVSLLRHKSDSQRRDSLAHLTTAASARAPGEELPEFAAVLIPKLQTLILDGSHGVRQQLLKLFRCLSSEEVDTHVDHLLLYTRAGMTHLAADIRTFALEVLDWLLDIVGPQVVSCAGGWIKTLQCFLGLLGWEQSNNTGAWSSAKGSLGRAGSGNSVVSKQLASLARFLRVGLTPPPSGQSSARTTFPYSHLRQHLLPQRSNAFARLNLFGAPRDEENGMYEDREDRQRLFAVHFQAALESGVGDVKREGGELGRAAAGLEKVIGQGMSDYVPETV